MKRIRLRDGKERSLLRRHPWVFHGSIDNGKADAGETVRVEAHDGRFLAWGAYSPTSTIRVRAWSFDEAERVDAAFFARRVERALALRTRLAVASEGVRLVHGEADGLPGLIVDRYGDTLVRAVPVGRRGTLEGDARRRTAARERRRAAVRTIRFRRARPRGTAASGGLAAR